MEVLLFAVLYADEPSRPNVSVNMLVSLEFLISLKAGGVGLNLTASCHCEERSDEAIPAPARRLLRFARNDTIHVIARSAATKQSPRPSQGIASLRSH
jgi:hypothetical protein